MRNKLIEQVLESLKVKNISKNYIQAIDITSDVIINPQKYTRNNKVAVIPLETGCGKSSITNISLAWLVTNNFPMSGTIVLKERISDCEDTVKQINQLSGAEVATPYHSRLFIKSGKYSPKYEAVYKRGLINYPILVMTHQGFVRQHQNISDYLQWTTDKDAYDISSASEIHNRTRLIVDEHPTMLNLTQITNDSLCHIESFVQSTSNHELFSPIFEICAYIRGKCFVKPADLNNQYWTKCDAKITDRLDKYFYSRGTTDETLKIYTALKVFCINGGFVSYSDDSKFLNITVGKYIDIFDKSFNSIILDGTAKISSLYKNKKFKLIELPSIKKYSNTTINICKQLNGSNYEIKNNIEIIDATLEYIKTHKPPNEDGLIITLKAFEEDFIQIGLPPRTEIDHFGNITGTNKYMKYKYLYIVGVPYLPDNTYKIAYHTYTEDFDMNKEQRSVVINGSRKLKDQDYREMSSSMIAAELIQAINRVRCRIWENGDTPETYIFMLSKDSGVIDLIQKCMEGIKIAYNVEFYDGLPEMTKNKKPIFAIDIVLSIISKYRERLSICKLGKKDIFNKHEHTRNLTDKAKSNVWKHPAIQQLESDGKIKVHTRYIEFLK